MSLLEDYRGKCNHDRKKCCVWGIMWSLSIYLTAWKCINLSRKWRKFKIFFLWAMWVEKRRNKRRRRRRSTRRRRRRRKGMKTRRRRRRRKKKEIWNSTPNDFANDHYRDTDHTTENSRSFTNRQYVFKKHTLYLEFQNFR